jgi:hypothetical protein
MRKTLLLAVVLILALLGPGCALKASPPPNVPHATTDSYSDCRGCHESGRDGAPVTDHAKKADCLSCHKALLNPPEGQ